MEEQSRRESVALHELVNGVQLFYEDGAGDGEDLARYKSLTRVEVRSIGQ